MTTTEQLHQQLDRAARIQATNKQLQKYFQLVGF